MAARGNVARARAGVVTAQANLSRRQANVARALAGTIPRGGTMTIDQVGEGDRMGFRVKAAGLNARIPQAVPGLLSGVPDDHAVDSMADG